MRNKLTYDANFYDQMTKIAVQSARTLFPWIKENIGPRSLLDVGCGTGAWLAESLNHGVQEIHGIDGRDVNSDRLLINPAVLSRRDLATPFDLSRRFDMVISLEVAEHLPAQSAECFVESLCRHSDTVVFSAAIPGQGGTHHLNEQWPAYWANLFHRHDYHCYDVVRNQMWNHSDLAYVYRQNVLVYCHRDSPVNDKLSKLCEPTLPSDVLSLIHPELFSKQAYKVGSMVGPRALTCAFPFALLRSAKRRVVKSRGLYRAYTKMPSHFREIPKYFEK